jgi:hypothetical protein
MVPSRKAASLEQEGFFIIPAACGKIYPVA